MLQMEKLLRKALNGREAMELRGSEVPFFCFRELLQNKEVRHGCATRFGGVSEGYFSTLNLDFTRGDKEENVKENFRRICAAIGVDEHKLVLPGQMHECNVRKVTAADFGKGIFKAQGDISVDAQVTNERGAVLAVFGSDCVPILFYDEVHHAIGTAHAGWKGSLAKIAAATVRKMEQEFGTKPEQVKAFFGPSICQSCYEVDQNVARRFETEFSQAVRPIGDKKALLDLWEVNRLVLLQAGVMPEHISIGGLCTKCNPEVFFSHRAHGANRGNLACFIALAQEKQQQAQNQE